MASQLATTIFRHKRSSKAPSAKFCKLAWVLQKPAEIPGLPAHEQLPERWQDGVPVALTAPPPRLEGSRVGAQQLAGSCAQA